MLTFILWFVLTIAVVHAYNTKHLVVEVKKTRLSVHFIWWKGIE